jgi:hypothetical protein
VAYAGRNDRTEWTVIAQPSTVAGLESNMAPETTKPVYLNFTVPVQLLTGEKLEKSLMNLVLNLAFC